MGRYRSRKRHRRTLTGLLVLVVGGSALYLGFRWFGPGRSTDHLALTSTVNSDSDARADSTQALRPLAEHVELAAQAAASGADTSRTQAGEPGTAAKEDAPVPPVLSSQPAGKQADKPADVQAEMAAGFAARDKKNLLTARTHLNKALHAGLKPADEKRVREALAAIADETVFSKTVLPDDPLVERYIIQSGNSLTRIARRFAVSEDFLAHLNQITDKNMIRQGAPLKVVHGPFHVSVAKRDHELHVYLQDVYVRTYRVALGTDGSTPTGRWKVVNHLENPGWTDPRSGKRWHANDPQNPIGEFWIGLEGVEGDAVGRPGFGIHGTIEPESIGRDVSLGCVRLTPAEIAELYRLLVPGESMATITD